MIEGISQESADILKGLQPEPTAEQYQSMLQQKIQSVQDRLAAARQNVTDIEAELQRHIDASNELTGHIQSQG